MVKRQARILLLTPFNNALVPDVTIAQRAVADSSFARISLAPGISVALAPSSMGINPSR